MVKNTCSNTIRRRFRGRYGGWTALLLCITICGGALAQTPSTPPVAKDAPAVDYSAIECLHKASGILGKPVDLIQLLTSPHLPSHGEVSLENLTSMVRDQGLYGDLHKDLTPAELRHASFPVLLHVLGSRYSARADHYILCLGIQDGQAQIFNPPASEKTVSLEALASRWQGEAIVLSTATTQGNLAMWRYQTYLPTAALAGLAVLSIGAIRLARRWRRPAARTTTLPRALVHAVALAMVAAAAGFGGRLASGQGLVVQAILPASPDGPDPMDFLLQANPAATAPEKVVEIDLNAALGLHATRALFIDAREASEFAAGHIKAALNCPASDVARLRLNMAGIPLDRKIAVYCVSSHCGKGSYLATALMQQGYTHVVLYTDGWVKWTGPKEPER